MTPKRFLATAVVALVGLLPTLAGCGDERGNVVGTTDRPDGKVVVKVKVDLDGLTREFVHAPEEAAGCRTGNIYPDCLPEGGK